MAQEKIRSAVAVLNDIRDGGALVELGQHIHDAVAAVNEHVKNATVIVTITIQPFKGSSAGKLVQKPYIVLAEVTSKLPKPDPEGTVFFEDAEGNLVRTQVRQPELGLSIAGKTEDGAA